MELFENNLEKELFQCLQKCEEKIIIISPFISLNIAEKLVKIVKDNHIDCKVITRFERKSFIEKASCLDALKLLVEGGVQVLALKDLHSKVYLFDYKRCFVGSANFTNKGLNTNHELLLYFDEQDEVEKFNSYAKGILTGISDWTVTIELIKRERDIIESYKQSQEEKEDIIYSWGAELKLEKTKDDNSVVLSVSAGDTIHLIEKYFVHAHPISKGYNYSPTKHIAFRRPNGGVMDKVYKIDRTLPIEMKVWNSEVEKMGLSDIVKERLTKYIVDRYRDFEFNKAPKYKFYLLSLLCDLPNEPHPPANNAGGWLYRLSDLKDSKGHVFTIRQMKK